MPKTRQRKSATPPPRAIPTISQLRRLNAMTETGKTFTSIAAEIAESDGKSCSRQLVEATVRDRHSWPNTRIRLGFAKAVGRSLDDLGWNLTPEKE